jgi:EAL and modified HD-GYP domain-containing signal transduction protein
MLMRIFSRKVTTVLEELRRWLGNTPEKIAPQDAFKILNSVAPLKSEQQESIITKGHETSSFICREAVLDRGERIAGYEFSLGRKLQTRMLNNSAQIRRVYDDAMLRNLAPLGVSSLLGERFAFIRLSIASLKNPLLKAFSNLNTIINAVVSKASYICIRASRGTKESRHDLG